jgi:hypothetical protein
MTGRFVRAFAGAFVLSWGCGAQANPDLPYRYDKYHVTFDIQADGSRTTTHDWQQTALKQDAVEDIKSVHYSFSTSIEKGEFLEAVTLKKDGRHIPAPPTNYQLDVRNGRQGASPLFSDRTSIGVVLPELTLGDTIQVKYQVLTKEPLFPGKESFAWGVSPFGAYNDVKVTVRYPQALGMRFAADFFKETARTELPDGRTEITWSYSNPSPRTWDPELDAGLWRSDETPMVWASSFTGYDDVVNAYRSRAEPKAAVTPRIQALSDQIVAGADPKDRARKLYEWVSRELTYGGNCIGVGAVVPRDLDVILDNRMGDCKDHATLLQALLNAQGIANEQVLVNAGDSFDLPRLPVVSMVNHVITHLTEANLYLDATAKQIPYGLLPTGLYGKPALHVSHYRPDVHIPDLDPKRNGQVVKYALTLHDDGSASGTLSVTLQGAAAAAARHYMRDLSAQREREWVKQVLSSHGLKGRGTMDRKDADNAELLLSDRYSYDVVFEVDDILKNDGRQGTMPLTPALSTPMGTFNFAGRDEVEDFKRPTVCAGFWSDETLQFELPKSMRVISVPRNLKIAHALIDYSASYKLAGRKLTVERRVADKTPTSVCSPALMAEFNKPVRTIARNLRSELMYQQR